jgi:hypothetical protein
VVVILAAVGTAHDGIVDAGSARSCAARRFCSVEGVNDAPAATPPTLPGPERALGPEGLGLRVGAPVHAEGWIWTSLIAPSGLDGPPGVLQGGLAAGLAIELARAIDPHGAPVHALTARLEAPTRLGVPFIGRVRQAATAGWYEVETWQDGRRTVSSTVELTGQVPLQALTDLIALAAGTPPPPAPDPLYPSCFVCGEGAEHPLALHTPPAFVGPDRLSVPWIPDERLGTGQHVAELVVAAALDCPSAWATVGAARSAGYVAVLLGSLHLQFAGAVEALDPVRITASMDSADGRKLRARSAVVDTDGRVLAVLDALHVAVGALPDV